MNASLRNMSTCYLLWSYVLSLDEQNMTSQNSNTFQIDKHEIFDSGVGIIKIANIAIYRFDSQ